MAETEVGRPTFSLRDMKPDSLSGNGMNQGYDRSFDLQGSPQRATAFDDYAARYKADLDAMPNVAALSKQLAKELIQIYNQGTKPGGDAISDQEKRDQIVELAKKYNSDVFVATMRGFQEDHFKKNYSLEWNKNPAQIFNLDKMSEEAKKSPYGQWKTLWQGISGDQLQAQFSGDFFNVFAKISANETLVASEITSGKVYAKLKDKLFKSISSGVTNPLNMRPGELFNDIVKSLHGMNEDNLDPRTQNAAISSLVKHKENDKDAPEAVKKGYDAVLVALKAGDMDAVAAAGLVVAVLNAKRYQETPRLGIPDLEKTFGYMLNKPEDMELDSSLRRSQIAKFFKPNDPDKKDLPPTLIQQITGTDQTFEQFIDAQKMQDDPIIHSLKLNYGSSSRDLKQDVKTLIQQDIDNRHFDPGIVALEFAKNVHLGAASQVSADGRVAALVRSALSSIDKDGMSSVQLAFLELTGKDYREEVNKLDTEKRFDNLFKEALASGDRQQIIEKAFVWAVHSGGKEALSALLDSQNLTKDELIVLSDKATIDKLRIDDPARFMRDPKDVNSNYTFKEIISSVLGEESADKVLARLK